jgi:hypothetical protein
MTVWQVAAGVFLGTLPLCGVLIWNLIESHRPFVGRMPAGSFRYSLSSAPRGGHGPHEEPM